MASKTSPSVVTIPSAEMASPATDDELRRLHVFISYATEDAVLAQALNAQLKTAFGPGVIETTLDSELKLGVNWRSELEDALSDADVLLDHRKRTS
jgi:hypothetical protein